MGWSTRLRSSVGSSSSLISSMKRRTRQSCWQSKGRIFRTTASAYRTSSTTRGRCSRRQIPAHSFRYHVLSYYVIFEIFTPSLCCIRYALNTLQIIPCVIIHYSIALEQSNVSCFAQAFHVLGVLLMLLSESGIKHKFLLYVIHYICICFAL